jgi:hypothetical protein
MTHECFAVADSDRLECEDQLIHEHLFIPERRMGGSHSGMWCVTCEKCYCHMCGKLLETKITT